MTGHNELRAKFHEKADAVFNALFDDDQQEQLITMTQREDRILQKGAELQAWLLEQHLTVDPLANPAEAEALRCPKCRSLGARDGDEPEAVLRRLKTRAGTQEFLRWKYRCLSCKTVFFPLGRQTRAGA
jgi:DNA-directed RNA polymerase subunit RPC12/RpoP